jgi:transcriptional regulator with XRE-family HTH domain
MTELRKWRQRKGWSLDKMAGVLEEEGQRWLIPRYNVAPSLLSKWERGVVAPTAPHAFVILRVTDGTILGRPGKVSLQELMRKAG